MELWEKINTAEDLRELPLAELNKYADEVRQHIIDTVKVRGGHLASNLGVVELSIALHYVFDCPKDKIVWDVGHQSYTHKILTGRKERFKDIRSNEGISGFPNIKESEYDAFTTGHSSTSLSAGLGLAHARDISGENHNIVCIIGDGALTGGMAYEALNDIGAHQSNVKIILNDNRMSISKNVGAMSKYLTKLSLSRGYVRIKKNIKKGISALPVFGDKLTGMIDKAKDSLRSLLLADKIFENLGIKYYGPFDGHDIAEMTEVFKVIKKEKRPSIIHVLTHKGSGYEEAESNPSKFHGIGSESDKKCIETNYSNILGNYLCDLAEKDDKVTALTAAMAGGTGLTEFAIRHPDRYFDVGIAEQHCVTMAAGMAAGGLKPYVCIYSTFLQRAFDQLIHDVGINALPVRFLIDRSGAVGADGVTHQGVYDLGYLSMIPGMTICTPKDGAEFYKLLDWSRGFNAPLAIRYPKSYCYNFNNNFEIALGRWEHLIKAKSRVYILAAGNRMLNIAMEIGGANIVNCLFIKPLDTAFLDMINKKGNLIITLEDNLKKGGFGEAVLSYYTNPEAQIAIFSHGDRFIDNRDIGSTLEESGIDAAGIKKVIKNFAGTK